MLWNLASGAASTIASIPSTGPASVLVFSPDGRSLAVAARASTVVVDVATGRVIRSIAGRSTAGAAFSPDGRTLAVGGASVRLVDLASGSARTLPTGTVVNALAFSPDGSVLAGTTSTGPVLLWKVATGRPEGSQLAGPTATTTDVAFSPDGRTVAASSADDTVHVWDVASHREIGPPLRASEAPATSVAFSPDGRLLASSGIDGTVAIWKEIAFRFDPAADQARLCSVAGRNLTAAEWSRFLPGRPLEETCPGASRGA